METQYHKKEYENYIISGLDFERETVTMKIVLLNVTNVSKNKKPKRFYFIYRVRHYSCQIIIIVVVIRPSALCPTI